MTFAELLPYNGFRVAVTMNSGLVHAGVLFLDGKIVRILQPPIPKFSPITVLEPENVKRVEYRDSDGWPVTNGSAEQTEAAAKLLRPFLGLEARLEYASGVQEVGVVSIDGQHGWVLLPKTVKGKWDGSVIDVKGLLNASKP
jgi:hypothetical protein